MILDGLSFVQFVPWTLFLPWHGQTLDQLTPCLHQEPQYAVEQFPSLPQEQHFEKEITQSEAKQAKGTANSNSTKFDKEFIFQLNKSNGSISLRAEQCQLHPPYRHGSIQFCSKFEKACLCMSDCLLSLQFSVILFCHSAFLDFFIVLMGFLSFSVTLTPQQAL